jgi:hypothetical protein
MSNTSETVRDLSELNSWRDMDLNIENWQKLSMAPEKKA